MAEQAEALTQLARLLGDEELRFASLADARRAARVNLGQLAASLTAEAAASDDVFDRDSGIDYLESRLVFLATLLQENDRKALSLELGRRVADW